MSDDTTIIELARRAVKCKGWRWLPGMLVRWKGGEMYGRAWWCMRLDCDGLGGSVLNDESYGVTVGAHDTDPVEDLQPDLSDPATLGCLLALVREAWGEPTLAARMNTAGRWIVEPGGLESDLPIVGRGVSELEALVAALEAAPA